MSTKKSVAVLGIGRPTDYKRVLELTDAVCNALTVNIAIYALPDPTVVAMQAQATILRGYVNAVNDGDHSKIELRNEASELLYQMLQEELIYVNKIGHNDRGILELSGFPVSAEPAPRHVPSQVIIKRIETGKEPKTAKIFIVPMDQTLLKYIVQTTTTPEIEASWKIVLVESNSHQLIIANLVHGQEIWIRVCASNANGEGLWSVPVSFIPQN